MRYSECPECEAPLLEGETQCKFCNTQAVAFRTAPLHSYWQWWALVAIVLFCVAGIVYNACVVEVPQGHVGVVVSEYPSWRGVNEEVLPEGIHVINPLLFEVEAFEVVPIERDWVGPPVEFEADEHKKELEELGIKVVPIE